MLIPEAVWAIEIGDSITYQKYPGPEGPRNENEPERIKVVFDQFILEYDVKIKNKLYFYKYTFDSNEVENLQRFYNTVLKELKPNFISVTGSSNSGKYKVVYILPITF